MCSKTLWHQNADQSMTICTRYWGIAHKLYARCVIHKLRSSRCHELMALNIGWVFAPQSWSLRNHGSMQGIQG